MKARFSVEQWEHLLSAFQAAQGRFYVSVQTGDRVGAERACAELEQLLGSLAVEAEKSGAPEGLAEMIQMERAVVEDIRSLLESLRAN